MPGGRAPSQCCTAESTSPAQMWHRMDACTLPALASRPANTPASAPHDSAGA